MNRFYQFLLFLTALLVADRVWAQSNAPTLLTGTAAAYNQVNLSWKDNSSNETKFEIERKDFTTFTKIGESAANIVTYQDKTVQANGSYIYRVRAVFATGNSGYSNEITVSTPTEPPGSPTGLAVNLQGTALQITWSSGSGGTATNFLLERNENGGAYSQISNVAYSRTPSYTDNLVFGGRQYCYRVRAQNGGGTSGYSNTSCYNVPNAATNVRNLKAQTLSTSSIKLTWDRYGKESGIDIERRTGQSGTWSKIASTLADGGEYTDNGLNQNTEYCYRIQESGREVSAVVCATTQAAAPAAPARLTASAISSSQIALTWADVSDNETGFQVERSTDGGRTFNNVGNPGANSTSYTDGGLSASTAYCYRVRAVNGAGQSGYTEVQCAATQAPPVTIPSGPSNLAASASSSSQINLSWTDNSNNETAFQVERSTDNANWTRLSDAGQNATTYQSGGLNASTRYYYRVRAVNTAGESGWSNTAEATTQNPPVTIPSGPSNLAASTASTSQINLSWTDNSNNETSFQVERSTDNANWTRLNDASANATTYQSTGLNASTKYYFRVRAVNTAGESGWSNVAEATTQNPPRPNAPVRLTASAASSSQINLQWADQSDNETGFEVERSPNGNDNWNRITTTGANATTYENSGLSASTRYFYRVRAVNGNGQSDWSNTADATTQAPPVTIPSGPSNLAASTASSSQINLTWADNSNNETGFEIERSANGTDGWSKVTDAAAGATAYSNTGLAASTRYYYRVRAVNSAGQSAWSNVADAITPAPPITVPNAPTNLVATAASSSQINLSWTDASANETGFEIERSLNGTDGWSKISDAIANATTFSNTGLTPNTRYYFRVRAVNTAGQSAWSNVANALTPALPTPATTTDLKAEVADYDQIKLSWGAVGGSPTGIVIERATSPTGSFTQVGQVSGTATTFTDTGLPETTTFYYRIRSSNANGPSGNSNIASAKTPEAIISVRPQPLPEGIYAHVDHGTLFVTLNWNQFQEAKLRVVGLNGREQLTDQCRINGGTLFQYDVAYLPAGVYVLCLDTDKNRFTKKIWIP